MANAGIDQSNVAPDGGRVLLLPLDPDRSAEALRQRFSAHYGCELAVIINDSFGRAWRRGTVGIALGVAGRPPPRGLGSRADPFGRPPAGRARGVAAARAAPPPHLRGRAAAQTPAR